MLDWKTWRKAYIPVRHDLLSGFVRVVERLAFEAPLSDVSAMFIGLAEMAAGAVLIATTDPEKGGSLALSAVDFSHSAGVWHHLHKLKAFELEGLGEFWLDLEPLKEWLKGTASKLDKGSIAKVHIEVSDTAADITIKSGRAKVTTRLEDGKPKSMKLPNVDDAERWPFLTRAIFDARELKLMLAAMEDDGSILIEREDDHLILRTWDASATTRYSVEGGKAESMPGIAPDAKLKTLVSPTLLRDIVKSAFDGPLTLFVGNDIPIYITRVSETREFHGLVAPRIEDGD